MSTVADKRTTEAEAVAELRDGMTIGFGGWGSRRKPMSVVKEILRSDLIRTMKLLGCASTSELDGSYVEVPPDWRFP